MKKLVEEVVERTGLHPVTVKAALNLRKHPSNGEIRPATRMAIQRALVEIEMKGGEPCAALNR